MADHNNEVVRLADHVYLHRCSDRRIPAELDPDSSPHRQISQLLHRRLGHHVGLPCRLY